MTRTDYALRSRRKNKKENIKEGRIVCAPSWAGLSSGGCTAIIGDAFKHHCSSGCTYYTYRGACIMTNERAHEDSSVGFLFFPSLLVRYPVGVCVYFRIVYAKLYLDGYANMSRDTLSNKSQRLKLNTCFNQLYSFSELLSLPND